MIQTLHTSDLHGNFKTLLDALEGVFDVWIDTGDFFPNKTRGEFAVEVEFQTRWFDTNGLGEKIVKALAGRPLISVGGNHDYANLAELVRQAGGEAFDVTDGPVDFAGKRFAGFREIPRIAGEWNGETVGADFGPIVEKTFACNPDIIVCHGPAAGIMDDKAHGGGVAALTSTLTWTPHNVTAMFFGHIHDTQGVCEEMGIAFINGAHKAIVHTI